VSVVSVGISESQIIVFKFFCVNAHFGNARG
jgi:hypothetical protein